MTRNEVINAALDHYGLDNQIVQLMEELAELSVALSHYRRNRCATVDVVEEIADVEILLDQVKAGMCVTDWELKRIRDKKLERLEKALAADDS